MLYALHVHVGEKNFPEEIYRLYMCTVCILYLKYKIYINMCGQMVCVCG